MKKIILVVIVYAFGVATPFAYKGFIVPMPVNTKISHIDINTAP